MSDLLSAASLLLGVLAILFGLWYPEITSALDITEPSHRTDYKQPYKKVSKVLYSRAIPLTIASSLLTIVFAPDAIKITISSVKRYINQGWSVIHSYDAVTMSFVLVVCLALTLTIYLSYYTIKLIRKARRLTPGKSN